MAKKMALYEFVSNISRLRRLRKRKDTIATRGSKASWFRTDIDGKRYKFELDPHRQNVAIVTRSEDVFNEQGEKVGVVKTIYRQEVKGFTPEGDMVLGRVDITSFNNKNRILNEYISYTNGMSRLDNGFDSLLHSFRMAGVPESVLNKLRRKWDMLSTDKKAMVFKDYRAATFDIGYGSNSFDERRTNTVGAEDVSYYVDALESAIDMAGELGSISTLE